MNTTMLAAALEYAERGWPVFPLRPKGKKPIIASAHRPNDKCKGECGTDGHGLYDATTDPTRITKWWERWPNANIGNRTGIVADVFDIDRDDPADGTADMEPFDMPGGPVVRTGAGWHFYVLPTGTGNRTRFTEHCDWRGAGGYSILPPSLHHTGRNYEWFTPIGVPLNPAPSELLAALTTTPQADTGRPPLSPAGRFKRGTWNPAGLIGKVAIAPVGTRNNTLCWAANAIGRDHYNGKATRNETIEALDQLERVAVAAGLTPTEAYKTIQSGFGKGVAGLANNGAAA